MFQGAKILGKTILPYTQYLIYAAQLGYAGYNLYRMYAEYVVQVQRDRRNGTSRSFDQTMEVVVKARRKQEQNVNKRNTNKTTDSNTGNTNNNNTNDDNQSSYQQQPQNPEPHSSSTTNSSKEPSDDEIGNKENSGELVPGHLLRHDAGASCSKQEEEGDDEITVVHDSRHCGLSDQNNQSIVTHDGDACDEVLSTGSTSIESTDSNNGIIKDMYNECFICARALYDNPDKPVATLPFCMHPFHKSCLDGILRWHSRCPVCDFYIFSPI